MGMSELIIVTLMAGGLMEVIRYKGGIRFILERLTRRIRGTRGAECCIAALVTLTDFCTANNTIAILTVGPLAKDISQHYGVDPRRSASLLDTFSCFAQGIIPYGAQMLIASGLTQINPLQIIPHLYYPFLLGAVSFAFILIHPKYEKDNSSAAASGGNT
jgi:Na+/H+ antiporter NhaC